MKKRISIMLVVILIMQILLPMLTVVWESGFTLKVEANNSFSPPPTQLEQTKNSGSYTDKSTGITWTYKFDSRKQIISLNISNKFADANKKSEIIIPNYINGKKVVGLSTGLFKNFINLQRVTIASGVTSLPSNTFLGCKKLTSVTLNSVTSIGSGAFSGCTSLGSISLDRVKYIGTSSFSGCTSFLVE